MALEKMIQLNTVLKNRKLLTKSKVGLLKLVVLFCVPLRFSSVAQKNWKQELRALNFL